MSRHNEPFEYDDEPHMETVSANRPPQFNESTCGYRCGWGCEPRGGEDDGGGPESDGTPTLIGSYDGDAVEGSVTDDVQDGSIPASPRSLGEMNEEDVEAHEQQLLFEHHILADGHVVAIVQPEWNYEESLGSLENQVASEPHSSAASDQRSIGSASPCGWDAGIGEWHDLGKDDKIPENFRVTPLRLSPQDEHCRGQAVSPMVIQDYSSLLNFIEEDWRLRMPPDGYGAGFLPR